MTLFGLLIAAALVAVAGYAQVRIAVYTASAARAWLTRAVLGGVGIALGYVGAMYAQNPLEALIAFLTGFGVVHLPAAIILFVKRARGAGKS